MVSASEVAQQVKEHQELHLQQEMLDLPSKTVKTTTVSFNCFCDQPTEHLRRMPESHQLTLMTYDLIDYHGRIEDASVTPSSSSPATRQSAGSSSNDCRANSQP